MGNYADNEWLRQQEKDEQEKANRTNSKTDTGGT